MIPPVSPYGLIQETLWPNEWKILVACILLNCTTRKSMEKVLPKLFETYPDASAMSNADMATLTNIIAPLGFKNRRGTNLIKMSKTYISGEWKHAKELPGIGNYAADAWEIFIKGVLPEKCPVDHALVYYYMWRKKHGS